MRYFAIVFSFFLSLSFPLQAQFNIISDPFMNSAEYYEKHKIKSIDKLMIELDKEGIMARDYGTEKVLLDPKGNAIRFLAEDYMDLKLFEGQDRTVNYIYRNDSLVQEQYEVYDFFAHSVKTYEYEGDLLVETKLEMMMHNDLTYLFEYNDKGQLIKKIRATRYPSYTTYTYDDDQLVREDFYDDEDDEEPYKILSYNHTANGQRSLDIEVCPEEGDTTYLARYNDAGLLVYKKERRAPKSGYSRNYEQYMFEESYVYNSKGQMVERTYRPDEYIDAVDEAGNPFTVTNKYYYENDRLSQVDSLNMSVYYGYNDLGQLDQISTIVMNIKESLRTKDTLMIQKYKYNKEGQQLEELKKNYQTKEQTKWMTTYEDGRKVFDAFYIYQLKEKCTMDHVFDSENNSISSIERCQINPRRLPDSIPSDMLTCYYNPDGQLIYQLKQYGDHDGSINMRRKDSIYYENGVRNTGWTYYQRGGQVNLFIDHYVHNAKGQLIKVFGTYEQDTLSIKLAEYGEEHLSRLEEKKYSLRQGQKYMTLHQVSEFGTRGELLRRVTYDREGAILEEETCRYNEQLLMDRYSLFKGQSERRMEERKTYKYEFY